MKDNIRHAVCILTILLMLLVILLSGCGNEEKQQETTAAPTVTVSETKAAAVQSNQTDVTQADDDAEAEAVETEADVADDSDGYIDRSEAVAAVKLAAGSGAEILDVQAGYAPDGSKAWVITVAPITKEDGPETVTYYSGEGFCYAVENTSDGGEDSFVDGDGYIDRSEAIAAVKSQAGSGALILDAQQGYASDGAKAWVVTVAPVTASEDAVTVTYYVNDRFCYSE